MPLLPSLLLLWAAGSALWFLKGDLGEYRRFKRLSDTRSRRRRYLLWMGKAWLAFGLPSLLGLALMGRGPALATLPPELAPVAALVSPSGAGEGRGFPAAAPAGGAAGGVVLGGVLTLVLRRRGRELPTVGDVGSLLPREAGELPYGALLAVTAGVTEELFFRLYLPLLTALVTGSAAAGFAAATALFAAMHLYQGRWGVLATGVLGAVLAWLYLASGALWVAVAVHATLDLNGLVLRPVLAGLRRPAAG